MDFKWISYSLAVAAWNTVFTGLIIGALNIIYAILHHPLLTKFDMISAFIIGYIILFALNVRIIDDEL